MAELREAHLRYLLAIYELGKSTPDVGTQAVAKALNCSKASVTKMMATLMDMNLLVRENVTAEGFERFISEHNFQIRQAALLGGSLAPLCYLEASIQK